MIEAAKEYLKYGFNVIPVNKDKSPSCDWKHWQNNKMDQFGLFTSEFIGIVCGAISDNLEVLDFDNHFGTAKQNLTSFIENELVKPIYEKYKLPIIQTQSGGFHLYYRCDKIDGNKKLASIPKYNEKLKKYIPDSIIETRGEGGFVVAPPSAKYSLIRNSLIDLQYITIDERIILHEVAKSFDEFIKQTQKFMPKLDNESPWHIYDAKPESINECRQLLINAGWTDLGYNNAWCRPGKNKGISGTFGKVAPGVFYCFTSNSEHFENDKGYSPFAIKSILQYNADFSACAKDLAKEYGLNKIKENKIEIPKVLDLEAIRKDCKIYFDEEYILPTVIIKIKDGFKWLDMCTLGNFSCFTGKSKARKSFASFFYQAGCIANKNIQNKFLINMPENKRNVIYFDTEQSKSHVARSAFTIVKMAEVSNIDNFEVISLRKYGHLDRCKIISDFIDSTKNLGIAFIDGIADLAFGNNDEEEANRVTQLLMYWTANYDIHINTVIHQTKSNDWATGHLGSAIEKKAETVINIKKDGAYSVFEPKQLRNCEDFTPFPFLINSDRIPELITEQTVIDSIVNDEL